MFLSTRKKCASFSDICIKSFRHFHNIVINFCHLGRLYDFIHCRIEFSITDVLRNTVCKKENFLLHNTDISVQRFLCSLSYIHSINGNTSVSHIIKSRDQLTERSFSATGRSYKRNRLTRFYMKGNILKYCLISLISKSDMIYIDLSSDILKLRGIRCILKSRFCPHQFYKSVQTGCSVRNQFHRR